MDHKTMHKDVRSAPTMSAEQLIELWQMPLRFWMCWWEACMDMPACHHLTKKELEDKRHAQLIVPEPLKARLDRDLFA